MEPTCSKPNILFVTHEQIDQPLITAMICSYEKEKEKKKQNSAVAPSTTGMKW